MKKIVTSLNVIEDFGALTQVENGIGREIVLSS
jgi:hypothetical protein